MNKKVRFQGIRSYWSIYGSWKAVLRSQYFRASFLFLLLLFPLWLFPLDGPFRWTDLALSVTPSFLSFSLAALAILLATPSGTFFQILADEDESTSFYLVVAAAFTHFIVVQILALFLVFLTIAYPYPGTSGLGFFTFCYSLGCGVAAVDALMQYALLRNSAAELEESTPQCSCCCKKGCNNDDTRNLEN